MANYTGGASSVCPFYIKEARMSITCEGFTDGTVNMTRFVSEDDKKRYQLMNCETYNYDNRCPLAAALMQKYKEG